MGIHRAVAVRIVCTAQHLNDSFVQSSRWKWCCVGHSSSRCDHSFNIFVSIFIAPCGNKSRCGNNNLNHFGLDFFAHPPCSLTFTRRITERLPFCNNVRRQRENRNITLLRLQEKTEYDNVMLILPLSRKSGNVWTLIVRVCTLFRTSYSWVSRNDEAPTKLMQKIYI